MRFAIAAVLLASLAPGAGVRAAPPSGIVVMTAEAFSYLPGNNEAPQSVAAVPQGWELLFVNADVSGPHTVTSDINDAAGEPIFTSDPVNAPLSSRVHGIEALAPGRYTIFCQVHNFMRGTIEILAPPA